MLYAILDDRGGFIEERSYNPPLAEKELEHHKNGTPAIAPMVFEEIPFDANTHRPFGFTYTFDGIVVTKRRVVAALTAGELEQKRKRQIKDSKLAALPDYEDAIELMSRIMIGIVERFAMTTDIQGDPRGAATVTQADLDKLKSLLEICEANN